MEGNLFSEELSGLDDFDWGDEPSNNGVEKKEDTSLKKLSTGRLVLCIMLGLLFSIIIGLVVFSNYINKIRYPAQEEIVLETTGMYALENYENSVSELRGTVENGYLSQEISYANGNENVIEFMKRVASTVKYTPDKVVAKNIYGNDMVDRGESFNSFDDEIVYIDSPVSMNEEVTFSVVDYSQISFDTTKVAELMAEADLKFGDIDYQYKLVDVFVKYINGLEELPTKEYKRVPEIYYDSETNSYSVLEAEDVYVDKVLFSSPELYDCMNRFSKVAGEVTGGILEETADWKDWNSLSADAKEVTSEPPIYGEKNTLVRDWCGAYYLQNDYYYVSPTGELVKETVDAQLGDGSREQPASKGTSVTTYVIVGDEKIPIRVKLVSFGVSEDAISWFESKNYQNRGFNLNSEVQYCYAVFQVTNLSDKVVVVKDNSSLCDKSANLSTKTGIIYGLQSEVTLQPDETGIVESWGKSTELQDKYLIWGADFARKEQPVWFRVLAGDLENEDPYKGVHVNTTRYGDDYYTTYVEEDVDEGE